MAISAIGDGRDGVRGTRDEIHHTTASLFIKREWFGTRTYMQTSIDWDGSLPRYDLILHQNYVEARVKCTLNPKPSPNLNMLTYRKSKNQGYIDNKMQNNNKKKITRNTAHGDIPKLKVQPIDYPIRWKKTLVKLDFFFQITLI